MNFELGEVFKESFCPLFLMYALTMLVISIKAAFFTHGMSKWDLLFALVTISVSGGYFAAITGTCGLIVNSLFNIIVPAMLLRYLGAERKPLTIITILFFAGTVGVYFLSKAI